MLRFLLLAALAVLSETIRWDCDFDYGDKCFFGMPTSSFMILNDTAIRPRQPLSDVWATQTWNSQGSCAFPYQYQSVDLYFCVTTSIDSPLICPNANQSETFLNCNEGGEYGYAKFDNEDTGDQTYELDIPRNIEAGQHCLRFYYFFSDVESDASIEVILSDLEQNRNETILRVSPQVATYRWNEVRQSYRIASTQDKVYFVFKRRVSIEDPFFIAIDEIKLLDVLCDFNDLQEPSTTTITTLTVTTSTIVTSRTSSFSVPIDANETTTTHGPAVCNRTLTPTEPSEVVTTHPVTVTLTTESVETQTTTTADETPAPSSTTTSIVTPTPGSTTPNGDTTSSNGGTTSPNGSTTSTNGGTTSTNGGTTSTNGGTTSPNGGTSLSTQTTADPSSETSIMKISMLTLLIAFSTLLFIH